MDTTSILRSELNDLIRAIPEHGKVARSEFRFKPDPTSTKFQVELPLRLELQDSPFYYSVHSVQGAFSCSSSPYTYDGTHYTWSGVISNFRKWLDKIDKEASEPDPSSLLAQGKALGDNVSSVEDAEPFNEQELQLIKERLSAIRAFLIGEIAPGKEQLQLIDEKLSYLVGAAHRQTRMDWANTAVGVMFTIATSLALAPEQANRLFHLTSQLIKAIFVRLLT